ncbi:cytochrome P450 [Xanthobacter sp. TB0139]|uniref:cytochrome P450 n=1 Tax=Xanthobacter sp. TB0139 TaxID=3459178 RepID=UPI00403926EA
MRPLTRFYMHRLASLLGPLPGGVRLAALLSGELPAILAPFQVPRHGEEARKDEGFTLYALPFRPLLLVHGAMQAQSLMVNPGADLSPAAELNALLAPLTSQAGAEPGTLNPAQPADPLLSRTFAEMDEARILATTQRLTEHTLKGWLARKGKPTPVGADLFRLALDLISTGLLDTRFTPQEGLRFAALAARYLQQANPLPLLLARPGDTGRMRLVQAMRLTPLAQQMRQMVAARFLPALQDPATATAPLPHLLAQTTLPAERAVDLLTSALVGGMDGIGAPLCWLAYELARDQMMQEGAAQAVGAEPALDGAPDRRFENHDAATTLEALTQETLRLHPAPTLLAWQTRSPVTLGPHSLPADAFVVICPRLLVQAGPAGAAHSRFLPERWLKPPDEAPHSALLPSAGANLHLKFIRHMAAQILGSTRLVLAGGPEPVPLARLSNRPSPAIVLRILPRPARPKAGMDQPH